MGRRAVQQITCDRCNKVEHHAPPFYTEPPEEFDGSSFEGSLGGDCVKFDDLCIQCATVVKKYWEKIRTPTRGRP